MKGFFRLVLIGSFALGFLVLVAVAFWFFQRSSSNLVVSENEVRRLLQIEGDSDFQVKIMSDPQSFVGFSRQGPNDEILIKVGYFSTVLSVYFAPQTAQRFQQKPDEMRRFINESLLLGYTIDQGGVRSVEDYCSQDCRLADFHTVEVQP